MKFALAITALALCSLSFAETPSAAKANNQREKAAALAQKNAAEAAPHSPFATSICSFTFTSGTNETFLKYCVTANGNITQLETPFGVEHIAVGEVAEGYGICDDTALVEYDDYADDGATSNWGPAVVVSRDATSVKIARTTSDSNWTLTQNIRQFAGTSSVNVAMTLTNNTAHDKLVFLMRYADVDAGSVFLNNFDGTEDSAFGWNSAGVNSFGMAIRNVGNTLPAVHTGFAQNFPGGPSPCNALANASSTPLIATDGSIVMFYDMFVHKGASKTVTVNYKGL
jgi:hypothetical protein